MGDYFLYYGLLFFSVIITLGAQCFVSFAYNKYRGVKNDRGITGAEAARYLLDKHGLSDIEVVPIKGYLNDHYDPRNKVIRLSSANYFGNSIASVAVSCHECGHALQDKDDYFFMRIRESLIPVISFFSYLGYVAILLGCFFGSINLIWIGILAEVAILLFQIITLPVEVDASKRALKELDYAHFFNSRELKSGKVVLRAAAMTYIASIATAVIEIFRLLLLFGRRDD